MKRGWSAADTAIAAASCACCVLSFVGLGWFLVLAAAWAFGIELPT